MIVGTVEPLCRIASIKSHSIEQNQKFHLLLYQIFQIFRKFSITIFSSKLLNAEHFMRYSVNTIHIHIQHFSWTFVNYIL